MRLEAVACVAAVFFLVAAFGVYFDTATATPYNFDFQIQV